MFDKETYWKKRKQRLRGQESLPEPKLIQTSNVMLGFDSTGRPVAKNRRVRRKKVADRTYTKKGYQAYENKQGAFVTRRLKSA